MTAGDYLTASESYLSGVDQQLPERGRLSAAQAQVAAIQAVAAAVDRLAKAVENLQH